ncbi:CusA/CzcA family heavy metal efflux RND transporter [bacterium]|nr:CusA/CzcA family heavy metal efflux RND transporter [bacterium]MBU1983813.1 CusA/CzcA family heavy metal efflux RND transporter [bacterium]
MIEKVIEGSIRNRFILLLAFTAVVAVGVWSLLTIPIDAIPDLSDVQVIVMAEYPGQAPDVIEDQVVYPLTTALMAVPHVKDVRGFSMFSVGMVYLIFEDGTDIYWARSRVLEYLNTAEASLPEGAMVHLGPDATGLGWVYQWTLQSDKHDLAELRSLQDWFVKFEVQSVPGVSEVASVGGFVKQYQVVVNPEAMAALGVSLSDVKTAIRESNNDVGGRLVEMGETEFFVRGLGYIKGKSDADRIRQIEEIPVTPGMGRTTSSGGGMGRMNMADAATASISPKAATSSARTGTPIRLKQVAHVQMGPELRRGIAEWNGEGEVVGGIAVVRYGENALQVINKVKEKLADLQKGLPEGVKIVEAYDRSALIYRAIDTLRGKLTEEMIVVALIIFVFLLHIPSSLVAIITLPVGVLMSFIVMRAMGINANIMSLGGIAIAIGVMVDASVVMVENAHKHLERYGGTKPRADLILDAAKEVGPALFFSLLIIAVSFFPIFALQSQEGRLFTPLAYTKTFAMAASSLIAVTLIPVLMFYFIRGRVMTESRNPLSRFFIRAYRPIIRWTLRYPVVIILIAAGILAVTILPWKRIGSEFMPPLNEGDLLYMPTTPPGISPMKARELLQQTDRIIKSFPEVKHVFGKAGRAETATDPAPLSMIETTIMLEQDRAKWRPGVTMDSLISELDAAIQIPGLTNAWTMPIRTRIDMLSTGIKTPVGIKIMGSDLKILSELGERAEALVKRLPGTLSAFAERDIGGRYLDIDIDREQAARYGLRVGQVQDVIASALGGQNVSYTVEGNARYPINVRYPSEERNDMESIGRIRVASPYGYSVPLAQVADIKISDGPSMIKTENARKSVWVFVDIRNTDVGTYVRDAKDLLNRNLTLPEGYSLVWSGQYEYMERVAKSMRLIVPLTVLIIFFLLYAHFRSTSQSLLLMVPLPFALVGGIWLMYLLDFNMSVAVAVGMIAMAGIAAETGVVMEVYLQEAYERYKREGRMNTVADLKAAIMEGAVERVRPKLMTVGTTLIGLLPIMFGIETGSEVMKRIAAPMVGGLITSTLHVLILIPAIYYYLKRPTVHRAESPGTRFPVQT